MRPEMYEYQYDWMMSTTMNIVGKAAKCSPKEREKLFGHLPYFSKSLDVFFRQDEASMAFTKLIDEFMDKHFYHAEDHGLTRVMTTFILNPTLLKAMNIAPLNCELITIFANIFYQRQGFDFMDHCIETGYTETSCSSQRATLGAYLSGMAKPFDCIVINSTGVCDSNANAFGYLANHLKKPLYAMDYPYLIPREDVTDYTLKDLKAMIAFVTEKTGNTVDYEQLYELLENIREQEKLIQEIAEMIPVVPCPVPTFCNFILYVGHLVGMGNPLYTDTLKAILKMSRQNLALGRAGTSSGIEKVRMYSIYLDHFNSNLEFFNWFDQIDAVNLGMIGSPTFSEGNEYLKGNEDMGWKVDTSSEDAMLLTCAEMGARQPMARSIRGPYDAPNQWLDETLRMMKLYNADCGMFAGTYGCRNTWANVQPMVKELEKHG